MASRFDSPVQRLAIVSTAAAALLAVLASSPPSCPMSVTADDAGVLAVGTGYEHHFTLESSAGAVGVISVFLESSSVARVLVHVTPDRVPDGAAMFAAEPVAVELAPGVRHQVEFPSFVEGVLVRVELDTGGEVALDVEVTAAQDDCHDNAFVKVVDG